MEYNAREFALFSKYMRESVKWSREDLARATKLGLKKINDLENRQLNRKYWADAEQKIRDSVKKEAEKLKRK